MQYQQPGLTKLVFDSTLTSNPEVEKKPVRSVRQIRQTMYVPMFSAFRLFKRMGGKVVNTSSVCHQPIRQTTNKKSHTHVGGGSGTSHLPRTETPSGWEPDGKGRA